MVTSSGRGISGISGGAARVWQAPQQIRPRCYGFASRRSTLMT